MPDVFILRLQGLLQAWGGHTCEELRPSCLFPTRSGLAGLLGACIGVRRDEPARLLAISRGFRYSARLDRSPNPMTRILDYHTIENARKVGGKIDKNPVVSRREYLCDARFTVALALGRSFPFAEDRLKEALRAPVFTPFLGRRSCPLTRPLLEALVPASSLHEALAGIPPGKGVIYSEEPSESAPRLSVRDVPAGKGRKFHTRDVFIYAA